MPIPPSSSGLLTSVAKASGSTSSQLGFNQLAYSSPPVDGGMASTGHKLPMANGPSHYGSSYNYQTGSGSLVTMSSDYSQAQGQMQYAYGDAQQRFGVNGPQAPQPGFGPTNLPPGYSSGHLPNQLQYAGQQGPMKPFHVPEKQSGSYSIGSDITVLYQSVADKQGTTFPAALSQPYDVSAGYQSGAGFQSGNQPSNASLPYPGVASDMSFQGLSIESGGFEVAGQYQNPSVYRSREGGQVGYDIGGTDSQRGIPTSAAAFSGAQGPASQSFSSNFGSQAHGVQSSGASYGAGGPSQVPPSAGTSFSSQGQSAQATSVAYGPQGQSAPASGSYGNQRQGTPSAGASAFGNHGQGSQLYGNQGQVAQSATTTIAQSQLTGSNLVSSNANASGKLADNLSKLGLKDGQQQQQPGDAAASMSTDGTSASSATSTLMSSNSSSVTSSVTTNTTNPTSKTSIATTAKSSVQQTSKRLQFRFTGHAVTVLSFI